MIRMPLPLSKRAGSVVERMRVAVDETRERILAIGDRMVAADDPHLGVLGRRETVSRGHDVCVRVDVEAHALVALPEAVRDREVCPSWRGLGRLRSRSRGRRRYASVRSRAARAGATVVLPSSVWLKYSPHDGAQHDLVADLGEVGGPAVHARHERGEVQEHEDAVAGERIAIGCQPSCSAGRGRIAGCRRWSGSACAR